MVIESIVTKRKHKISYKLVIDGVCTRNSGFASSVEYYGLNGERMLNTVFLRFFTIFDDFS